MWLFRIIILGLLYFFNAVYSFLPKWLVEKFPIVKFIGIVIAIMLVIVFIYGETVNYRNYSYAKISKEGNILESKNFNYEVKKAVHEGNPAYIICDKYDIDNLTVTPYEAATVDIGVAIDGIRIIFVGSGVGDPVIATSFKIEIRK